MRGAAEGGGDVGWRRGARRELIITPDKKDLTTRLLNKLRLAHKLVHRILSASIKVEFSAIEHHLQPPYMRVAAQNLAAMLIPMTLLLVL